MAKKKDKQKDGEVSKRTPYKEVAAREIEVPESVGPRQITGAFMSIVTVLGRYPLNKLGTIDSRVMIVIVLDLITQWRWPIVIFALAKLVSHFFV